MPKYLFTNEISDKIISILSTLDPIKTVCKGDLSRLPKPELFKKYMPMIIVKPEGVQSEWANLTEKILSSIYKFRIFYLIDYNIELQIELTNLYEDCITQSQPIGELLLEYPTLEDFKTENGLVTSTVCKDILFSNGNFEFFKQLEIPCAITEMEYEVNFRTYSNRMRR